MTRSYHGDSTRVHGPGTTGPGLPFSSQHTGPKAQQAPLRRHPAPQKTNGPNLGPGLLEMSSGAKLLET